MPRIGFICPDTEAVRFDQCLTLCRMKQRCLTKSTMASMAQVRPFVIGHTKPSTTLLLKPTRIAYLEIVHDYFQSPQDLSFMFIGSRAHKKLEGAETNVSLLEQFLHDEEETGVADCYEDEYGTAILTDYKTIGAFAVAKSLGIVKTGYRPTGTINRTTGKPVTEPIFEIFPERADVAEYALQLNRYRLFYTDAGFRVDRLQIQAFVRDAGAYAAREFGITENIYLIPIQIMPALEVRLYFDTKRKALLSALESKTVPPICTKVDNWNGRRCNKWCNVAHFCHDSK